MASPIAASAESLASVPVGARIDRVLYRIVARSSLLATVPLTVMTLTVLLFRQHTRADQLWIAGLALATGLWHEGWQRVVHRHERPAFSWPVVLATGAGAPIMVALTSRDPLFLVALLPIVPRAFMWLPYLLAFALVVAVVIPTDMALVTELQRTSASGLLFVALVHTGVVGLIGLFIQAVGAQQRERVALLASLATSERHSGQLEERQRLAREIHDTLAQGFAAILTHLEAAERAAEEGARRDHTDSARAVARESLEEARRMMAALMPEALERADLPEAVRRTAEAWMRRTGVPAVVEITGEAIPLQRDLEVALLRAEQEGLANAWKHARASRVAVTLSYIGDVVALDVQDDGIGGAALDGAGFGLTAMRERVARIGGSVSLESAPGEGTTLTVTVPSLRATAERPAPRAPGSVP